MATLRSLNDFTVRLFPDCFANRVDGGGGQMLSRLLIPLSVSKDGEEWVDVGWGSADASFRTEFCEDIRKLARGDLSKFTWQTEEDCEDSYLTVVGSNFEQDEIKELKLTTDDVSELRGMVFRFDRTIYIDHPDGRESKCQVDELTNLLSNIARLKTAIGPLFTFSCELKHAGEFSQEYEFHLRFVVIANIRSLTEFYSQLISEEAHVCGSQKEWLKELDAQNPYLQHHVTKQIPQTQQGASETKPPKKSRSNPEGSNRKSKDES